VPAVRMAGDGFVPAASPGGVARLCASRMRWAWTLLTTVPNVQVPLRRRAGVHRRWLQPLRPQGAPRLGVSRARGASREIYRRLRNLRRSTATAQATVANYTASLDTILVGGRRRSSLNVAGGRPPRGGLTRLCRRTAGRRTAGLLPTGPTPARRARLIMARSSSTVWCTRGTSSPRTA